jgi:2'-5' RNA ligase
MSRIRTFIAVDIDKPVRDRLIALQESLARTDTEIKWVEPKSIHLTLLFLGEVDDRELISVCRAVSKVCAEIPPFVLGVESVGCFPNARRPRILWAGIGEGAEEATALHDALEIPLLELRCYRREDRPYTPHVTLGRVQSDSVTAKLSEKIAKSTTWQGGQTTVREVLVMSSEMMRDGPTYSVMSRAKLAVPSDDE